MATRAVHCIATLALVTLAGCDRADGSGGSHDGLGGSNDGLGGSNDGLGGSNDGLGGSSDGLGGSNDGLGGSNDGLGGSSDGLGGHPGGAGGHPGGAGGHPGGAGGQPDDPADHGDCPPDVVCIDALPFAVRASTLDSDRDAFDAYGCAPDTDESGPEVVYRVDVAEPGFLALEVDGMADGVDIDLHLLRAGDAAACIDRGHRRAGAWVEPGRYFVVADTWVDGEGRERAGDFDLTVVLNTPQLLADAGMDAEVARKGLRAFATAWTRGDTDRFEYALTDFSLHSVHPRQWIVDLRGGVVLWNLHVAHGRGSSPDDDTAWATTFSNVPESHQSSLGLMRTAEPYIGDYGSSFRLDGLEPGYNDNVRRRDIVMHPWEGSRPELVAEHGQTGPTWGCPALDDRIAPDVADLLSDGTLSWFWFPDGDWSERSEYLPRD